MKPTPKFLKCNILLLISILSQSFFSGCGKKDNPLVEEDVLVMFDGKKLTTEEVISRIPIGLSPEDSLLLFNNIIDNWISTNLLIDLANKEIEENSLIEEKVDRYRNRLIVMEYMRRLSKKGINEIPSDSLLAYYEANKEKFICEEPLVKGLFIKIDENSESLSTLDNLVRQPNEKNIDKIEQLQLQKDFDYEYFGDKWQNWHSIAALIPNRISHPDSVLKKNKFIEGNKNGQKYMLYITDYLPAGSQEPFETASFKISETLQKNDIEQYETHLIDKLRKKAILEEKLILNPSSTTGINKTRTEKK